MSETSWQTGLWRCETCQEVLGVFDYDGQLWLRPEAARQAETYENVIVVACRCATSNRWYRKLWPPQDPTTLKN